jgi:hypothetical protein
MKQKNNYRYLLMGLVMALASSAVMLSCKDDDPSLAELRDDKITYLADSIRVSDSLRRLNQAGVVNYAITVVDGSTSTFFKLDNSRTEGTKSVLSDALVTISQFGKVLTDTTDASGMVVLNGFFRGAVNVVVAKEGFTTAAFVTAVKVEDATENGTISFVGNLIPIFATTGANTATVSGVAKIQSDLTNSTRENVPDGTTILAHINVSDNDFAERFLTPLAAVADFDGPVLVLDGVVLEAAYSTGVVGTTAAGAYTVTVPAAIDGLPIVFEYSDVALDRLRFEASDDPNSTNRTITERTIYGPDISSTYVDPAGGVTINFDAGSGATAAALVTEVGTVESVTVISGGSAYNGTPRVEFIGGGGTGATGTAVVSNGVVTGVNIVNKGTGYTSSPAVVFHSGVGAAASSTLDTNGTVASITVNNTGAGYTSAPTVSFVGGGTPTTPAAATAIISGGRVTAINVTNPGVGYTSAPAVNLTGGGFTVAATASANFSGVSVQSVNLTNPGSDYAYAPSVVFSAPQVASGVRATGTATVDPGTGVVTGIQITNAGSGYTAPPTVTIQAGSGAIAQSYLTGGAIMSIDVIDQGGGYTAPPTVKITSTGGAGGSGATATATVVAGRVTAINVTAGGSGYVPGFVDVELISGEGAKGVATIVNGVITGVRVTTGGSGYTGAPVVTIIGDSGKGNGATATATVAGGQVTGITVTAGGTGYVSGNTPGDTSENFTAKFLPYNDMWVKPGIKYVNDIYYGTGAAQQP